MHPNTLAEAVEMIRAGSARDVVLAEFVDRFDLAKTDRDRYASIEREPKLTGDDRLDALIGAIAEYLAKQRRLGRVPHWVSDPFFDTRATNWVGLITHLPPTEDYVPVLPWFGMMLAGYLIASLLMVHARAAFTGGVPSFVQPLSVLGRWSLSFYMLHQPILIGSLELFRLVFK